MNNKIIYADNAATTQMSDSVYNAMLPHFKEHYGNPSSIYSIGQDAKYSLEQAREDIAKCFNAQNNEIYFTSGGSESNNWAIKGAAATAKQKGKIHIISSKFEHHAVLHPLMALKRQGYEITLLDVYDDGMVKPEDVKAAIKDNTALVSIMFANNEIGTIQQIGEIGAICKEAGVLFHTDAVQAVGNVPIDVVELNIDLMSISGHKIKGPKGVGLLYARRNIHLSNLIDGGSQERGKRAGTESLANIIGLAQAIKDATSNINAHCSHLKKLTDTYIAGAVKIERSRVNSLNAPRLPGVVNMCFEGIEGEALLLLLDAVDICASSGSACTSGSLDPSHVLLAIGLPHEIAHGSLRLSFNDNNTLEEVDYILAKLPGIIERLRFMSPLWERIVKENN